jgi:conjugal transfer/entry exclusion protein
VAINTDIARLQAQIDEYRNVSTDFSELDYTLRQYCNKLQAALNDLIALMAKLN